MANYTAVTEDTFIHLVPTWDRIMIKSFYVKPKETVPGSYDIQIHKILRGPKTFLAFGGTAHNLIVMELEKSRKAGFEDWIKQQGFTTIVEREVVKEKNGKYLCVTYAKRSHNLF